MKVKELRELLEKVPDNYDLGVSLRDGAEFQTFWVEAIEPIETFNPEVPHDGILVFNI